MGSVLGSKALVKVGYGCNQSCTFCHARPHRHLNDSAQGVAAKIERAAGLSCEMVVLSGGEPTMRPELLSWASRSAELGLDFGLVTNGQMLAYPELIDELVTRRLHFAYVSLHGGSAEVHDAVTRADGFSHTVAALRSLAAKKLQVTANCVVCRTNLAHLREIVDLAASIAGLGLQLSMVEAKGGGLDEFGSVVPDVAAVAAAVGAAIRYARRTAPWLRVSHDGIPLCLFGSEEDENAHADLRSYGFRLMSEVWETDFFPIDDHNRTHPPLCQDCARRGRCPGLYRGYAERRGADGLRPASGLRSNAFNYVRGTAVRWPEGTACPLITAGTTPYDRGRTLWLREGAHMYLCEARSRDFSDADILQVKDTWGQIYLDYGESTDAMDFSRDLRKLRALEVCGQCPRAGACARCYEVDPADIFRRDDAELNELLGSLRGTVLDVGCGAGRYLDALAEQAGAGTVRYRGVDPDPEAVQRLRRRYPWAEVDPGAIEDIDLAANSVDHVLMLQSYNHLPNPAHTIARLGRALKPGGTMLVADNVAFGLVRTVEQTRRAEASAAAFEHHRCHGASEAQRCFAGLPGHLESRREIGPASSNQWFLRYRWHDQAPRQGTER